MEAGEAMHAAVTDCPDLWSELDAEEKQIWAVEEATVMAHAHKVEREPDGYAYHYAWHSGGTVLRFNGGEAVNGSQPIEAVPYWLGKPPSQPNKK